VLIVDRIYIRKGGVDYSSLTFRLKSTPDSRFANSKAKQIPFTKKGAKAHGRFWAKLEDVNAIECNIVHDATKAVTTKTVSSCGRPMTLGEFKRELNRRKHGSDFWVKFTINGKVMHDEIACLGPARPTYDRKYRVIPSPYISDHLGIYGNTGIPPIPANTTLTNEDILDNVLVPDYTFENEYRFNGKGANPLYGGVETWKGGHVTICHIDKTEVDVRKQTT